jgi:hypothetical protein
MRRSNAKNLTIALVTLADPKAGAMLKVIDEAHKFLKPPRRRKRRKRR